MQLYNNNMEKACFAKDCTREVETCCICRGKATYMCKKHIMKHISLPNEHAILSLLLVSLYPEQVPECLLKFSKTLKYIREVKATFIDHSNKIIKDIEEHTKKLLKIIRDTEKGLLELIGKVCIGKKVNKEQYEITQRLVIPDKVVDLARFDCICESLNTLYDFKLFEQEGLVYECEMLISPRDKRAGGLFSIDLTTFKSMPLNYAPIIGGGVQATRIDKDSYFFYGGRKYDYSGDIFILNLEKKYYQTYESSTKRAWGAAVYKNGKVHIFGGHDSSKYFSTCKTFEIETKLWLNIASLPLVLQFPTAAICNNMIIVAGESSDKAYVYENDAFSPILNIPGDYTKMVCEGWIVSKSILYESQSIRNDKWAAYQITWNPSYFFMPTSFQKNQFIYFINGDSNDLWRIDTKLKTLAKIEYS